MKLIEDIIIPIIDTRDGNIAVDLIEHAGLLEQYLGNINEFFIDKAIINNTNNKTNINENNIKLINDNSCLFFINANTFTAIAKRINTKLIIIIGPIETI